MSGESASTYQVRLWDEHLTRWRPIFETPERTEANGVFCLHTGNDDIKGVELVRLRGGEEPQSLAASFKFGRAIAR